MKRMSVLVLLVCFSLLLISCDTKEDNVSDVELESELNLLDNQELKSYATAEISEDGALSGEAGRKFDYFRLTDGRKVSIDSRFIKLSKNVLNSRLVMTATSTCASNCNDLDSCYMDTNLCQGTVLLVGDK